MKRSFASSRQSFFLIFIFILIAATFTFYYFNYVDDKRDALIKRNFSQLHTVNAKVQQILYGLSISTTNVKKDSLFNYHIDSLLRSNRSISEISSAFEKEFSEIINDLSSVEFSKESIAGNESLNFNSYYDKGLLIEFNKRVAYRDTSYLIKLRKEGLKEFLEKKISEELFDDFFLASDKGGKIIQLPRNIITVTSLDTIRSIEGETTTFAKLSKRDAVARLSSGNEDYMLFIHPMQLNIGDDAAAEKWVVCGVVNESKFKSESNAVSPNIVLIFLVIVFLIVLAWPLLKLRFVSRYGHIRSYDITMAAVSVTLAAAVLTFTIADFITYEKLDIDIDENLELLSSDIQKNFLKEICLAHTELDNVTAFANEKIKNNTVDNFYNFIPRNSFYTKWYKKITKYEDSWFYDNMHVKYPAVYKYFNFMHWTNAGGDQQFKFLMKKKLTPFINLSKREYFQNVLKNEKLWDHSCKDSTGKVYSSSKIFLQPLVSLTTGDFSLSLSKASTIYKSGDDTTDKAVVGAVDFLPVSVYSTVLPTGFSFCIIDKNGQVIFHSNKDRNLTENFLDQNTKSRFLKAAISSRSKEKFISDYWGKTFAMLIKPIEGLPWYTVVMFDKDLLRRNNLETASVSLFLFLIYIVPFIVLLLFFIMIKGSSRNWVWPVDENEILYKRLFVCYLFLSAILLSINLFIQDQTIIFFSAWLFPHSALLLTGLMIILKIQRHSFRSQKKLRQFSTLIILIDAAFISIIIFSLLKMPLDLSLLLLLIVWFISMITGQLILFEMPVNSKESQLKKGLSFRVLPSSFFKDKKDKSTIRWYSLAAVALLILGSVLPSVGFFRITSESMVKIFIKQSHLDYYQKLEQRREQINNYIKEFNKRPEGPEQLKEEREKETLDIYFSSFYKTEINKGKFDKSALTWFDTNIVHSIIPQIGETGLKSKVLTYDSDDKFYSWYLSDTSLVLKPAGFKEKESFIVSELPLMGKILSEGTSGFWFMLLITICGCLVVFYFTIRYIIINAFLVHANRLKYYKSAELLNNNLKQHILFLSRDPSSIEKVKGKINAAVIDFPEMIKEEFDPETKKAKWTLKPVAEEIIPGSKVIINNFEYGFSNQEINRMKLLLLEDLIYTRRNTVIIISSVHPLGGFTCTEHDAAKPVRQNILNRWKEIFSGFISTSFYNPERLNDVTTINQEEEKDISLLDFAKRLFKPDESPSLFIEQELKNKEVMIFHPEIYMVAENLENIIKKNDLHYYNLYDLAMDRTSAYHQYLWDSCSIDEKLVLVRLAQDRFVPVTNISTVENLLRRGLLKRDPNLKPYNILFTHFILDVNHPEEVYWDEQNSQSGWSKFRIPILIIIAGIIIFLFSTQTELYSNTLAIITAASALLPAALRLFGAFQPRANISKGSG